jgi:hypothetical protein
MFGYALCVEAVPVDWPAKLKRLGRIQCNDPIVRSALSNRAVCEHRWRRIQSNCSTIRACRPDIWGQCISRQAGVRDIVVAGSRIRSQCADVGIPRNAGVNRRVALETSPCDKGLPSGSGRA